MSHSLVKEIEALAQEKGISTYQMCKQLDCHKNWHGWKHGLYTPSHEKTQKVLDKINELSGVNRIAENPMQPSETKSQSSNLINSIVFSNMSDNDKIAALRKILS